MMNHPSWDWFVLTICRGTDSDRATRFRRALDYLGAEGGMGDLDDGPEQKPLDPNEVRHVIREGLPRLAYDFVFTHGPYGEYTRHRRHEECCHAVTALWAQGVLEPGRMNLFAFDDAKGTALPRARPNADQLHELDEKTFSRKYHIITKIYGFADDSWEARVTPAIEGFVHAEAPSELERLVEWRTSSQQLNFPCPAAPLDR